MVSSSSVISSTSAPVTASSSFSKMPNCFEIKSDLNVYRKHIEEINDEMAKNALRVLAMGYKEIDHKPSSEEILGIEKDLIFLGTHPLHLWYIQCIDHRFREQLSSIFVRSQINYKK